MRTAAVKDSNDDGAGYETAIKGEGGVSAKPKKSGTSKAKKAAGGGGGNPLSGLFGSK